jgi:hypothetical protein
MGYICCLGGFIEPSKSLGGKYEPSEMFRGQKQTLFFDELRPLDGNQFTNILIFRSIEMLTC